MISFDKAEIKKALTLNSVFELLELWGGDPEYTSFGIISETICHNAQGGSRKLYYYENSGLFHCWTHCNGSFDIFELCIKVHKLQKNKDIDLNEAIRYVAQYFGISGTEIEEDETTLEDWKVLERYAKAGEVQAKSFSCALKTYDDEILSRFNYTVKIGPWLQDGIKQEAIEAAHIGYYPGGEQITIPHYDKDGKLIGVRGRTLIKDEAERYGKYRPLIINTQMFSHPLGMNLYNLNNSKDNIARMGKAIVFEGEKSCLQYRSYFGSYNDISVATCGSSISAHQMYLLIESGAKEVIIAFDRQFQKLGDDEYNKFTDKLKRIHQKWKNYITVSFIFDKKMITDYKASPTDEGAEKFIQLYNNRVFLERK